MEKEVFHLRTELEELTRTATDYAAMVKRKEGDIEKLREEMRELNEDAMKANHHIVILK